MKTQFNALWIVLFLPLLLMASLSAYGVDGKIKIAQTPSTTFPIRITQSGSYVLTNNITSPQTAISVEADNVTLDLNGYSITGPGKSSGGGVGIYSFDKRNLVIKNGTIQNFGYDGIAFDGASNLDANNRITDVNVFNNGRSGITSTWGSVTITNCISSDNGSDGISVRLSNITNCVVARNGGNGISLREGYTISGSTATGNGHTGFWAGASTLTNCTARNNSKDGIEVTAHSHISHCSSLDNERHGVLAGTANYVVEVNVIGNGNAGIILTGPENYVAKDTATNNAGGNFVGAYPTNNYMPTSLTAPDAANANIGW